MKRRGFLQLLASGLVGAAVDVDKLLWQPGAKSIFDLGANVAPTEILCSNAGLLQHGDIFIIEGPKGWALHPVTREPIPGRAQLFLVTGAVHDGRTIPVDLVYPRITMTGRVHAKPLGWPELAPYSQPSSQQRVVG